MNTISTAIHSQLSTCFLLSVDKKREPA